MSKANIIHPDNQVISCSFILDLTFIIENITFLGVQYTKIFMNTVFFLNPLEKSRKEIHFFVNTK